MYLTLAGYRKKDIINPHPNTSSNFFSGWGPYGFSTSHDHNPAQQCNQSLVGITDTREKNISKIHFYSVAIFKSLWSLKYLRKGVVGTLGVLFHPISLNNHQSFRERERNCCYFSVVKEKYIVFWWGWKSKALFQTLPQCLQSWVGQNLIAQTMLAVSLMLWSSLFPWCKRFPFIILSIQPPQQQAAGSSHITRCRPGNDVMPPDSWVGVSYRMRLTRLNDMLGLSKGHVTYSPSALEDLSNSFVPKYILWHCCSPLIQIVHFRPGHWKTSKWCS